MNFQHFAPVIAATMLYGCASTTPPPIVRQTWDAVLRGHTIKVKLISEDVSNGIAAAQIENGRCAITLGPSAWRSADKAFLYAHEIGHCMDYLELGFNHNGFTQADVDKAVAYWGGSFNSPTEAFAQTYAWAYYKSCDIKLEPLGWPKSNDGLCDLPIPQAVTSVLIPSR